MATLEAPLTRRWRSLCDDLQHPDVELTVEEFAALLSVYKLLRAEGHQFSHDTIALMTVLERQAADSLDGFEDDTDSDIDNDECATSGIQVQATCYVNGRRIEPRHDDVRQG